MFCGASPFLFGAMFAAHADFIGKGRTTAAHLAAADFAIVFAAAEVGTRLAERAVDALDIFVSADGPTCSNPAAQCLAVAKHPGRQAAL